MSVTSQWGTWRVSVSGVDVTYFRRAPAKMRFQKLEPFGCGPGTLTIPALSPIEDLDVLTFDAGGGDERVFHYGAIVNIWKLHPDGTTRTRMWSGKLGKRRRSIESTRGRIEWVLIGDMEEASRQNHQPDQDMDPEDIGIVIPRVLNRVVGRRYHAIPYVETGILTTNRGSDDMSVLAYVQDLLSVATTPDGDQWTVRRIPDSLDYEVVLKERDTIQWNVTAGGFGVHPTIELDESATRYYGQGVNKAGGWWGNYRYPGFSQDSAPAYPFASPGTTITLGTTDGDTTSGNGVTVLQERINDLGYSRDVAVDGVYSASDARAVREIQEELGLTVDGVVGGQTWTGAFNVGGGTTLGRAVRLPLAVHPAVQPRLFNADGSDAGPNPSYDPLTSPPCLDQDIQFGAGVSRAEGRASARAQFARDWPPGHLGDLGLRLDPEEGSKFDIEPGENIRIKHLGGGTPEFHIAAVDVDTEGGVTLAVDQKARDLLSQVEIRNRNRESSVNPARIPTGRKNRRATQSHDAVVPFDSESPAGRIPRFAAYAGLWSVIHIPVSQAGRLAKVRMRATPATKWAMVFFGAPVTPAQLNGWVGNPLTQENPWEDADDDMDDGGAIQYWGSSEDACGLKRNGDISGVFKDDGTLEYRSLRPPWVWIGVIPAQSTFITGRLYPAPMDA